MIDYEIQNKINFRRNLLDIFRLKLNRNFSFSTIYINVVNIMLNKVVLFLSLYWGK